MFTFRNPTQPQIRAHLERAHDAPFTYTHVGCTRDDKPPAGRGWNCDQERVLLGRGRETFERGQRAIRDWRMFPGAVAQLCWPDVPIEVGRTVGVLYRARPIALWMLFPARIAYVIDEGDGDEAFRGVRRFGFANGTIADHPEIGEERFLVEWDRGTDEVWYDLLAVSRPGHWLARLGYPYTRYEQARFRRLSCEAMVRVAQVQAAGGNRLLPHRV